MSVASGRSSGMSKRLSERGTKKVLEMMAMFSVVIVVV